MSSAKSLCRREPPIRHQDGNGAGKDDSPLIVVGHGTGSAAGDATLHALAANLAAMGNFDQVRAAVLRGTPALADVLHQLEAAPGGQSPCLLPFMMSDGVTSRQHLMEAMAHIPGSRKPFLWSPLGLNPGLAELISRRGKNSARAAAWPAADCRLLLIAHGSLQDPASALAARTHQERIAAQHEFAAVEVAFLDQPPHLDDVLACSGRPLLGIGLFAGEGRHGAEDMNQAFALATCPACYCGTIGGDDGLAALALEHLKSKPMASL